MGTLDIVAIIVASGFPILALGMMVIGIVMAWKS